MYRPGSSRCRYVAWTDAVAQPMRSRRLLAPPRLRSGAHLATHAPRLCIATCLLRHHKPSECMRRLKPISLRHQRRHLARPAHAKHDSPAVEGGETGSVAGCCCKSIPSFPLSPPPIIKGTSGNPKNSFSKRQWLRRSSCATKRSASSKLFWTKWRIWARSRSPCMFLPVTKARKSVSSRQQ